MSRTVEISLTGLSFHSPIGVMEQEKAVGNDFSVDISVRIAYNEGMRHDQLESTISYADLYDLVKIEMSKPGNLLEATASAIVEAFTSRWPRIEGGNVTICKTTPPISGIAGSAKVTLFF